MTPQEQQASDVMHRELGVKMALPIGGGTDAQLIGGRIRLDADTGTVFLDQKQIRNLEAFLTAIGWRCS